MKKFLTAVLMALAASASAQTYNSQVNNLTANGSITANSSSVTANAFFGNGAGITGISTAVDTNTLSGIVPTSKGGTQVGTLGANQFMLGNGTGAVQTFSTMTMLGNGNVGIGTTNPGFKLEVTGGIYSNGDNVYVNSGKVFSVSEANPIYWGLVKYGDVAYLQVPAFQSSGIGFVDSQSGHVSMLVVQSPTAGKVGIDTTNPQTTLDVNGTVSVKGLVAFSSVPVMHVGGNSAIGTLASGTTFATFIPDSAVTLRRVNLDVVVAGIGGAGDIVSCNATGATGVSATLSAAAAAGSTATGTGSTNIAAGAQVYCHIDSGATTRPIINMTLEYVMQ